MASFLKAEWRKLIMFNYAVDPALLQPFVPPHTELDMWDGTCYVSLVGFMFVGTRVKGLRVPFHTDFQEVNLRFYVKYHDPEKGMKRGVVFIKEIVPKRMISLVANTLYRENYITLPMRHTWEINPKELKIEYALRKNGRWFHFGVTAKNEPAELVDGSETEFITEHFWGYAKWDDRSTNEYEVGHPRWVTYPVSTSEIDFNFENIYGEKYNFLNEASPVSIYLAEGSEIFVNKGKVISSSNL